MSDAVNLETGECQLAVEPFFQCCCTCKYLMPVHHHCCTSPDIETPKDGCKCTIQKGWACVAPEFERVYDNWPKHSCGCELHTTRALESQEMEAGK